MRSYRGVKFLRLEESVESEEEEEEEEEENEKGGGNDVKYGKPISERINKSADFDKKFLQVSFALVLRTLNMLLWEPTL